MVRICFFILLASLILFTGCNIEGAVNLNGKGLEGVTVVLTGDTSQTTTTDKDGKYVFRNIGAGQYSITPTSDDLAFTPKRIDITKSSDAQDVTRNIFDVSSKYFIIASPSTFDLSQVADFINLKQQQGYEVMTKTKTAIEAEYPGIDLPEKIRNYLIDAYSPTPVGYVMLIGSYDSLPPRDAYPYPENHDGNSRKCVPTDFYYMDLTGIWDADEDGFYGEYGEDQVGKNVALVCGRIPFDDHMTIAEILERIISFETSSDPYKKDVLFAGARVVIPFDVPLFINSTIRQFVLPSGFTETAYYEDVIGPYCDGKLTRTRLTQDWASNSYGTVGFFSHGNNRALYLGKTQSPYFDTDVDFQPVKPAIILSTACSINDPSIDNSLGMFLFKNGFAVTLFGSSRNALTSKDLTTFQAQVKLGEYYFTDGNTLGHTLLRGFQFLNEELEIPEDISGSDHFQNLYGFNILGDPSIRP